MRTIGSGEGVGVRAMLTDAYPAAAIGRRRPALPASAAATIAAAIATINAVPSVVRENTNTCAASSATRNVVARSVADANDRRRMPLQPQSVAAMPIGIAAAAIIVRPVIVAASGDGVNGSSSRLCAYLSAISFGRSVKSAGTSHATAKNAE